MLSLIKRRRDPLLVLVLLLAPLWMFLHAGRRVREPNVLDRALLAATAPVQRGLISAIETTRAGWIHYVSLRSVRRDNEQLAEDVTRLRAEVNALGESKAENERLRRLLNYSDARPGPKVVGRVLGINPDSNRLTLRIDRGEADGVARDMPVVTADGVVGRVVRVGASSADVLVVFDPNSRIGARVQRTRARASAAGTGEDRVLRLDYLLRSEDLEEGDLILTSGTDGVFPPGLVLGRVTQVERQTSGMFLAAGILPAVSFSKLEEVFVLPVPTGAVGLGAISSPSGRVEGRR